jgi:hypothetical protein
MRRILSAAIVTLLLAFGVSAQTAPDAAALTKLLNEFLAGASRNDPAVHDRFWADDVIYTGSAGRRRGKAEIMHDVRSAPAPKPGDPTTVYTAEDVLIQQYGDTAIVAFRLVATTVKGATTDVMNYLNSGTFVKRNSKWQVVNWQSTKMPTADSETAKPLSAPSTAPASPPAKPALPAATPNPEEQSDRSRDGLFGPVRRVRTELAKLSSKDGKPVEGKRVVLEVSSYDEKGNKVANQYFPIAGENLTGRETYHYDDKGNIAEMTLLNPDGSLFHREVYKYEYDFAGNWNKLTTLTFINNAGKESFEPTEVTYRSIMYYLDENMMKLDQSGAKHEDK